MLAITPCRNKISDRFPVASFVVHVPPHRVFEVACATHPALFRAEHQGSRTPENFFTSRGGGLLRAPAGQATYLVPPEQLRRFAGQRRLYYAVGSYGDLRGGQPEFSVPPGQFERAPSIILSPDFTGRALDRSRVAQERAPARYGSAAAALTWGGDRAPGAEASAAAQRGPAEYDDGYPPELWDAQGSRLAVTAPATREEPTKRTTAGDAESLEYEEAPDHRTRLEAEAYGRRSAGAYGSALARSASSPAPRAAVAPLREPEPPGHEDAVALRASGARRPSAGAAAYGRGGPSVGVATEPPGAEHPADLRGAAPYGSAGGAEPVGFEDAPDLRRGGARYGDGTAPAATAPAVQVAQPVPPGVDAEFEDALGPDAEGELPAGQPVVDTGALTILDKFKLIQPVAAYESGEAAYSALNPDGEFNDPTHPAYQRTHYGLSWGLMQFNQRGGALGRVLIACERRAPVVFRQVFGAGRDALVQTTNAGSPEARVGPVSGAVLWQEPWLSRFREAGKVPQFQAAQNEVAIEGYLDPNLAFASALGLDTDRGLAMVYDRCVQMGNAAGRRWIIQAVTPLQDAAAVQSALTALGQPSVQAFQRSLGLSESGTLGPKAHAALIGALRGLGTRSPVTIPSTTELLDRLVQAAKGRRFERRVAELRTLAQLADTRRQVA